MKTVKILANMLIMMLLPSAVVGAEKSDTIAVGGKRSLLSRISLGAQGETGAVYRGKTFGDEEKGIEFLTPNVTFNVGVDFGRGWSTYADIAIEAAGDNAVSLDQLYVEKKILPQLTLRLGEQTIPVGYINGYDQPTDYFTVGIPEGEEHLMPCTWHSPAFSVSGEVGDWSYNCLLLPGLNSLYFSEAGWISEGARERDNRQFAVAGRVDNSSVEGLRIGVSGYIGRSSGGEGSPKGTAGIYAFDFTYDNYGWIARGSVDYGHLHNARRISAYNTGLSADSPGTHSPVGKHAVNAGIECGYDLLRLSNVFRNQNRKLYVFGRYDCYNTYIGDAFRHHRVAAGVNWIPVPEVVVKAEFSERFSAGGLNVPAFGIGVSYSVQLL